MLRRGMLLVAHVLVAGCLDLSTDPDEIVAIDFNELPWPSIVAGDTLRDSTGAIATLGARLFDGSGDEVTGTIEFLSRDQEVQVIAGDRVVADDTASGSARLLASTAGLQSVVRTLEVVAAPDSMAADGVITPLSWVVPDDPGKNLSVALGVRVFSRAVDPPEGVRSWIVSFELEVGGQVVARTDTTQLFLVNEAGRLSYADTTDTQGRASRRLRVRVPPIPPDSVVIRVRASYKREALAGSPLRLVLPLQAR
jgi:hypothetical protein